MQNNSLYSVHMKVGMYLGVPISLFCLANVIHKSYRQVWVVPKGNKLISNSKCFNTIRWPDKCQQVPACEAVSVTASSKQQESWMQQTLHAGFNLAISIENLTFMLESFL